MNNEVELLIRQAETTDALALIHFLNQVGQESDFMTLDEKGIQLSEEEMALFIERQALSDNQLYLLAILGNEIAGVLSITADQHERVKHIGDVFIVVQKKFWRQGLGQVLLEEGIGWANYSQTIKRLQLSVQRRNKPAIRLYKKLGFQLEGIQERGAFVENQFVDVYLMGKMIG